MSPSEISPAVVQAMEQEERLTGLGIYGEKAMEERNLVLYGKRICGVICLIAEKASLPTAWARVPGFFICSPALDDLRSAEEILRKPVGMQSELTDQEESCASAHALYRLRLRIDAMETSEFLGKFIHGPVMDAPISFTCLSRLPEELSGDFLLLSEKYNGVEISSIGDQLVELTEKVALASGQEMASAFAHIVYRQMLRKGAVETLERLLGFIHGLPTKAPPRPIGLFGFHRSHNGDVENGALDSAMARARASYPPTPPPVLLFGFHNEIPLYIGGVETGAGLDSATARARYGWMLSKEALEAYEGLGISPGDPYARIIDIPSEKYGFFKILGRREELDGYKDVLKNIKKSDHMAMISNSILAMTAQVGGAILSSAFTNSPSKPKWALDFVEVSTVAGFGFTLGGIGLRRIRPMLSGVMIKAGAIATASAIIASLAMNVSPAVAWSVGPIAAAVVGVSVAVA